jgi:hypothetical protein
MNDPFLQLKHSTFRRNITLQYTDRSLVRRKGLDTIRKHAYELVNERLLTYSPHDGHQTPYAGHPVFTAQHATATCCRTCLFNWHKIPLYRELTQNEIDYGVSLIMRWISNQLVS